MVDLDKIEQAAEAAAALRKGQDGQWWYDRNDFFDGIDFTEDADFAAECDPQTILKLIAVVRAAKAAAYALDLIDDGTIGAVCSANDALRDALEALK